MSRTTARFWNVRPMPSRARTWTGAPDTSWPSKTSRPLSGLRAPVMTSNKVDFPAPLGPRRAVIVASRHQIDTSLLAVTPPNRTVTPSTSSSASWGRDACSALSLTASERTRATSSSEELMTSVGAAAGPGTAQRNLADPLAGAVAAEGLQRGVESVEFAGEAALEEHEPLRDCRQRLTVRPVLIGHEAHRPQAEQGQPEDAT